jgi:ribonuclease T
MSEPHVDEVYVSVDVETSGPIPSEYSLLSLGATVVGAPDRSFYLQLRPLNQNAVPAALAVSGFDLQDLAQRGEEPSAGFTRFRDWIADVNGNRKTVFVGFNAGFDWSFVNWYFHRYLGENPFGFSPHDIKAYYMGLSGSLWAQTTSSKLPTRFQPTEGVATHNALDDARVQAEMFAKLLACPRSSFTEE